MGIYQEVHIQLMRITSTISIGKMEQSTYDFLHQIDKELLIYVQPLMEKAFTSTKTLKYIREEDLQFALPGHRLLILAHARKIPEVQE